MDADLLAHLETLVRSGFQSRAEVIVAMREAIDDEGVEVDPAALERAVDDVIAAVRAESRSWPEVTDNDRLDRAFAALTADGVIARQDFACCTSCAQAEIWDEVPDPGAWRGNVWFHHQDTERAVQGEGLFLGFGARDPGSRLRRLFRTDRSPMGPDDAAIGRQVADALTSAGLPVIWDGRVEHRIQVDPFVWQRRPLD